MRIDLLGKPAAGSCAWAGAARASAAARRIVLMSVQFRTGRLDDFLPAGEVALDLGAELLGRVRHGLDAVLVQALEEIRAADHGDRVVVDFFDDLARRPRR